MLIPMIQLKLSNYQKAYFERMESDPTGLWYGIDEVIYLVMNPRSGTPYGTSKIERKPLSFSTTNDLLDI